eukprot:7203314-Pyramimonas_sp.AAC.1
MCRSRSQDPRSQPQASRQGARARAFRERRPPRRRLTLTQRARAPASQFDGHHEMIGAVALS